MIMMEISRVDGVDPSHPHPEFWWITDNGLSIHHQSFPVEWISEGLTLLNPILPCK